MSFFWSVTITMMAPDPAITWQNIISIIIKGLACITATIFDEILQRIQRLVAASPERYHPFV